MIKRESISIYLKEIRRYPTLTIEELHQLHAEGNFDLIVKSNLRLVLSIAKNYTSTYIEDAIQAGNIGIILACTTWNSTKGNLLTWINNNIRWEILQYLNATSRTIRVPIHRQTTNNLIEDTIYNEKPLTNFTDSDLKYFNNSARNQPISIHTSINEDGTELSELISDTFEDNSDDDHITYFKTHLSRYISHLKEEYQKLIMMRYFEEKSPIEISIELNQSRQNIDEKLGRAITKLKNIIINDK